MTEPQQPPAVPPAVPPGHWPPVAHVPPQLGYGPPSPHVVYGQPPYALRPRTNTLAIVALVAIFVFAPLALVLGLVARSQISKAGEGGGWMAWTAIIAGGIATVLYLVGLVFLVALLGGFEWLR